MPRRPKSPKPVYKSFYTTGDISRLCEVSRMTVCRWIWQGILPASTTAGGHYRVRREDLITFLEEQDYPIPSALLGSDLEEARRILVIDDDESIRETLARMIASMPEEYEVATASSGYEAGVKMATFRPHLVILDIVMPGLDGLQVLQRIREEPLTANTRIIIFSSHISEEMENKLYEEGADYCLEKPSTPQEIQDTIRRVLFGRKRRRNES